MSRSDETDDLVPAGAAASQVNLLKQLYRTPTATGQCQPCRGSGKVRTRGGQLQTCPSCKGRGRVQQ